MHRKLSFSAPRAGEYTTANFIFLGHCTTFALCIKRKTSQPWKAHGVLAPVVMVEDAENLRSRLQASRLGRLAWVGSAESLPGTLMLKLRLARSYTMTFCASSSACFCVYAWRPVWNRYPCIQMCAILKGLCKYPCGMHASN